MARWRLAGPHYLSVPGIEWEYTEVDRQTGRPKKTKFAVPLHLDPNQPSDWNHNYGNGQGEIIVSQGSGDPKDIEFVGEPTPDMVPLDDEAKAISAALAKKWKHPIESLPGTYGEKILEDLSKQVDAIRTKTESQPAAGVAELINAMTQMMQQNQAILNMLAQQSMAVPQPEAAPVARRA